MIRRHNGGRAIGSIEEAMESAQDRGRRKRNEKLIYDIPTNVGISAIFSMIIIMIILYKFLTMMTMMMMNKCCTAKELQKTPKYNLAELRIFSIGDNQS